MIAGFVSDGKRLLTTIECLPNTGHQFVFLPLFGQADDRNPDSDWVRSTYNSPRLSRDARSKLVEMRQEKRWKPIDPKRPWLQLRVVERELRGPEGIVVKAHGLALAIETNLGNRDRGYVFTERKVLGPERRTLLTQEETTSPFVAVAPTDLDPSLDVELVSSFDLKDIFSEAELVLRINWLNAGGSNAIPVDLIVDFGNTRTVVLVVEHVGGERELRRICRPLLFSTSGDFCDDLNFVQPDLQELIPDSWFILREPPFEPEQGHPFQIKNFEHLKKEGGWLSRSVDEIDKEFMVVPDMFRQLSPALIGAEARRVLASLNTTRAGLCFLSSPKRYAWDSEPTATAAKGSTFWTMEPNEWGWRGGSHSLMPLRGEILRFVPRDLSVWFEEEEAPYRRPAHESPIVDQHQPNHPRAAGLVWTALTILETAQRQINSQAWRDHYHKYYPRVIDKVILTVPPGWTGEELIAYHNMWILAGHTFHFSRKISNTRPQINFGLDEALAAQLPFVYSEISHLGTDAKRFISLFGRRREGDADPSLRVMTIDIGGGTTDTGIVEYRDEGRGFQPNVTLDLIFRDSSTNAGDRLVKLIIEEVLLPELRRRSTRPDYHRQFRNFFTNVANLPEPELAQRRLFTRMVFLPIVMRWLTDLVDGIEGNPSAHRAWQLNEIGGLDYSRLQELNAALERVGLSEARLIYENQFPVNYESIRRVITEWLEPIIAIHARYVAAFGCDLVVITGKCSEQPIVRQLFVRHLPIFSNRVITAKGYFTGDWAPMGNLGTVQDAKLVTALGAALFRAIDAGLIPNWTIKRRRLGESSQRNYWGIISQYTSRLHCFMKPEEDAVTVPDMDPDSDIGRALFLEHSTPEQVYHLRWRGPATDRPREVTVEFERVQYEVGTKNFEVSEGLKLLWAAANGMRLPAGLLELKLCTLPAAEAYWLDSGSFELPE